MWATLEKWGYGGELLSLIKSLYRNTSTTYKLGNIETKSLPVRVGLKQGCVLSPLLFSLYIMELGKRLEQSGLGAEMNGTKIPALFFADDIVLIGEDCKQLKQLLNMTAEFGEERKLVFNPSKSKIMVNWREPLSRMKWKLGSDYIREGTRHTVKLEEIDKYKYLGVVISLGGRIISNHELAVIEKGTRHSSMIRIFCRGSMNPAWCAKVGWEKVVLPACIYGCEAIANTVNWTSQIEKLQNKMARFITGGSDKCSIIAMQSEIGWIPAKSKIAQTKLTYSRRFEWDDNSWGRDCWIEAKVVGQESSWWKEIN